MKMVEKILTDTPVKELIIEEGQVVGIIGEGRNGQKVTIHAKAVILASGGSVRIHKC